MCLPVAIAAASAVGSIVSFTEGSIAASKQNKMNQRIAARNKDIAEKTAINQYQQLNERQLEEQNKAAQQITEIARQARDAKGAVSVQAAGAGVKGQSVEDLIDEFERQELENIGVTKLNLAYTTSNIEMDKKGVQLGLDSRLLASLPDRVRGPGFGSLLGGLTDSVALGLSISSKAGKDPDKNPTSTVDDYTQGLTT
jgi:hypothetical protein